MLLLPIIKVGQGIAPSLTLVDVDVHGVVPVDLLHGTSIPIPKGHNLDPSDSDNYRGITFGSMIGRLFDL